MLALALSIYAVSTVVFVAITSACFARRWLWVPVAVTWTTAQLLWYFHSPHFNGPPMLIKSRDRDSFEGDTVRNWGDTSACRPQVMTLPQNAEQVVEHVLASKHVRVVGGGHTWSALICSDETVMKLDWCDIRVYSTTVQASAGCTVDQVEKRLEMDHKALYGFGGIRYQTLAGSLMTSLHGAQFDAFAEHVVDMHAVLANGTIAHIEGQDLRLWKHSMGMLGIMVNVTLKTWPMVSVLKQTRRMHIDDAIDALRNDSLMGGDLESIWGAHRDEVILSTFGSPQNTSVFATTAEHTLLAFGWDNLGMPLMILMSTFLSNFNIYFLAFTEMQKRQHLLDAWEIMPGFGYVDGAYSVPYDDCKEAMRRIRDLDAFFSFHVRRLHGSDDVLAFAPVESCIIDVSYLELERMAFDAHMNRFFRQVEAIILEYGGRPHWGKYWASPTTPSIPEVFREYRRRLDPNNTFMNAWTRELMFGEPNPRRYIASAVNTRGFVWKFFVWLSVSLCLASTFYHCWSPPAAGCCCKRKTKKVAARRPTGVPIRRAYQRIPLSPGLSY